jgi:hypothetical protein
VKSYPHIEYAEDCPLPIHAFDKLDGSNIRAEWSLKRGWYKFGSRAGLLPETNPILGKASDLVLSKYGDELGKSLKGARFESAVCFFEYWGPNSFAGLHQDEEHTVTLFDVAPYRQEILPPKEFLRLFGHLDTPRLLYVGPVTHEFIGSVRDSTLEGMTFEGVVCKAADKKTKTPIMFKQKSRAWLDKLRVRCGDNRALFERLK